MIIKYIILINLAIHGLNAMNCEHLSPDVFNDKSTTKICWNNKYLGLTESEVKIHKFKDLSILQSPRKPIIDHHINLYSSRSNDSKFQSMMRDRVVYESEKLIQNMQSGQISITDTADTLTSSHTKTMDWGNIALKYYQYLVGQGYYDINHHANYVTAITIISLDSGGDYSMYYNTIRESVALRIALVSRHIIMTTPSEYDAILPDQQPIRYIQQLVQQSDKSSGTRYIQASIDPVYAMNIVNQSPIGMDIRAIVLEILEKRYSL